MFLLNWWPRFPYLKIQYFTASSRYHNLRPDLLEINTLDDNALEYFSTRNKL